MFQGKFFKSSRVLYISSGVLFIYLFTICKKASPYPIDLFLTTQIQSVEFPYLKQLMFFITSLGNFYEGTTTLILAVLFFTVLRKYREAILIFISTSGGVYLSTIFKNLAQRPRPDPSLIQQFGNFRGNDSFPSGHVMFAIGLYGFLLYLSLTNLKKGFLKTLIISIFSFVIFFMSISRIYLGAHWFTDTLGSYLLGIVWIPLMAFLYKRLAGRL